MRPMVLPLWGLVWELLSTEPPKAARLLALHWSAPRWELALWGPC